MRRTRRFRGLRLWYNSFNIRYILCNKLFKVFLERLMSKEKPTLACNKNVEPLYYFDAANSHLFYT